jgi:hypothetical protein
MVFRLTAKKKNSTEKLSGKVEADETLIDGILQIKAGVLK